MRAKRVLIVLVCLVAILLPSLVVHAQYGIDTTLNETELREIQYLSISGLIGSAVGTVLSMIGILFFVLMIYAGIIWMTASGNAEKEKKALNMIFMAVLGFIIVMSSYVLVSFIFSSLGADTSMPGAPEQKCVLDKDKSWDACLEFEPYKCPLVVCKIEEGQCVVKDVDEYCLKFAWDECDSNFCKLQ